MPDEQPEDPPPRPSQDIDWTAEESGPGREPTLTPFVARVIPQRLILTMALLLIFFLTVIFAGIAALNSSGSWANMKDLLQILAPIEAGFIGTALGYYFGSSHDRPTRGSSSSSLSAHASTSTS